MKQSKEQIKKRQRAMISLLKEHGNCRVSFLASTLQVSELTVRRDLEELEKEHLIERFHGGARFIQPASEQTVADKTQDYSFQKDLIGKVAASMIPNNSTIFLGSGTTTLSIIKHLGNKRITIVTNNALAPVYTDNEHITMILCGGECRPKTKSLIGPYTEQVINSIFVDMAFLGANAIDALNGVTTNIYQEAELYKNIASNCASKIIMVATGHKLGKTNTFKILDVSSLKTLITDSTADAKTLSSLKAQGVNIIFADE
ncbi:DeoR/GlpR family DNA-binding transcription regulator [Luxibacter massiliensis]|uniref:DeoR/GlpR family DNA-binding transcription regulator n=1 Tax=Luxibacter massiliensis TaxID=2219695 RepID=UPI000F061DE5|nr:DeoR/GlpR family DNA-binding transcription regulator [Luxibacter massiliensis]